MHEANIKNARQNKKIPFREGIFFGVESEGFEPTSRQEPTKTSTCLAGLGVPATHFGFPGNNQAPTWIEA